MSELNIYQRINAVMKEVQYVQKDAAVGGGGQAYKAVTHDQVVSVAREALVKNGVMIYPEQLKSEILVKRDLEKQQKMHLYSGDYAIHFVNIDNGDDRVSVTINAHAADNGDKAPGKCATYATKTAILKVLCLETGENDESRAEARNTISEDQKTALAATINGSEEVWKAFRNAYKVGSLEELPASKFEEAKTRLSKYAEKLNGDN